MIWMVWFRQRKKFLSGIDGFRQLQGLVCNMSSGRDVCFFSLKGFLRNERENALLTAIEETRRSVSVETVSCLCPSYIPV